jgi:acyl transferase domain-containing protein/NADPH:quinone reductase-like Zn-dependent oxidoreductase
LEAAAIGTFFSARKSKTDALYVSSLKANFGHLEGAAGLAGLIKTVLVLEKGMIPPLAGLEIVNPDIDIEFLNIRFPLEPTPWPGKGLRRASVNSFGFGGTNAHVVLDDAHHYMQNHSITGKHRTRVIPPSSGDDETHLQTTTNVPGTPVVKREGMPVVLAWSAKDGSTLEALTSHYDRWLSNAGHLLWQTDIWSSLAYTLLQRRSLFSWRSFTVVNPLDISEKLNISKPIRSQSTSDLSLAFIFTGQGAQWVGMGKELFCYEIFRKSIIDAVMYLMSLGCYWHTIGAFLGDLEPANRIDEPGFAQPLCTILQIALVELLASINVHPALVVGHSSGEIAAAYTCGAIDRQSAWKLAYLRGACSNELAAMEGVCGAMIAVGLGEQNVKRYLDQIADERGSVDLVVACVNSPMSVTVSGNKEDVELLRARLEKDSVYARTLRVPVAYHSRHMEYVASGYLDSIGEIKRGNTHPSIHVNMVSSVTGGHIDKACLLDPGYWVRNMVSQVKFMQALQISFEKPRRTIPNKLDFSHREELWATDIVEIGPHGALAGPIRDCLRPFPHGQSIVYSSALARKKHACTAFLASVGQLLCRGYPAQLSKLNWVADNNTLMALPNLPQYPFNHSKAFWYESRISKSLRFRQSSRNAFLGAPVTDWNPLDARWRHSLVLNGSHWIADHRIKGQAIFPAAGMINMAIEAASQLAGDTAICAFEITNVTFHSALDLSAWPDGIEVSLQMTARRSTAPGYGSVHDWCLRVYQNDFTEVCRGTIRSVPVMEPVHDVGSGNYETQLSARARSHFSRLSMRCLDELDGNTLYERLWNRGYHFGPSFRRIQSSKSSTTGEAIAEVSVLDGHGTEMPTVVHPATLDGILQTMLPGITEGGQKSQFATSLPTRIERLWISKTGLLHKDTKSIQVAVKIQKDGFRTTKSDIMAFSQDASVKVYVEGIETTAITDGVEVLLNPPASEQRLCYNLVYKPDIDRADLEQLEVYLTQDAPRRATSSKYKQDLDLLLYDFISKANAELATPPSHGHLHKYFCWMRQQLDNPELARAVRIPEVERPSESCFHDLKKEQPKHSKIYYRAGEHLANLVSGTTDPLTLLFRDSAMSDFYEYLLDQADYMTPVYRYLEILTHKNPAISVLEVGAGTGAATKHLIKYLTRKSSTGITPMYSRYCFTDISPSFFARAQSDLSGYPNMDFKVFNLENNPMAQGFEAESFDLIVASLVLHATESLDKTLQHLYTLLKPGGRLIAVEVTAPDDIQTGFVFGLLPGWWLGADTYRQNRLSPCLKPEEWHHAFACNGFSGVDHVFWDTQEVENRLHSVMISTKLKTQMPLLTAPSSVAIVSAKGFDSVQMRLLEAQLQGLDVPFVHTDFHALSTRASSAVTLVIVIDSYTNPLLESFSGRCFDAFKKTLERASDVLWISPTNGSYTNPSAGTISGLARTLRSENAVLRFTTFEADVSSCPAYQGSNLRAVLNQCLSRSSSSTEPEVLERQGMLQIPRLMEDVPRNMDIVGAGLDKVQREVHFGQANLRLTVKTPGLLDSLYFEQSKTLTSELAPNEVEVRVKAAGVNFKDCLVALGRVSDDTLGTECAGVVEKVGSSCSLRPGDRVVVLALDTYRSIVRCNEALVVQIPQDISYLEASKLPTNFVTAYHALVELGRITAGETVLIHAGAGGTGQAAIQVALHHGAEVFVTVGSKQKKELVMSAYGIAADHIFYSRDTSFAQGIRNITNGRGVDLVLNSLAGEGLRASWECIAPYGRFLEIGKKDIFSRAELPMYQFAQNVSFSAIDIAAMTKQRPQLVAKSLKAVVDLLAQKKVRIASPLKVFSIHEIEEAFRWLQSGLNAGSVAVEMDHNAMVPVSIS